MNKTTVQKHGEKESKLWSPVDEGKINREEIENRDFFFFTCK